MRRVKSCFGHYGEKEEKNCRYDCEECIEKDVIFCDKKIAYPCDILCDDINLCKKCYWMWWDKNRNKRCSLKDEIKKFMGDNKLIINKKMRHEDGKDKRRTNKNR